MGGPLVAHKIETNPMTTESMPNENVQAVINDLNEWTRSETKLMYFDRDHMRVEIDLNKMVSDEIANLVEWLIRHDWNLSNLEMTTGIAEMSGQAYEVK